MSEVHEPGTEVKTSGEYVTGTADGQRTGGPIHLEAGDEFPPVTGGADGWLRADGQSPGG